MKTAILSLLALCVLPQRPFAQVTISTNEFYYTGDVIQMISADPVGTTAGAQGAGITWNFSTLSATTTPQTTTVADNTSGIFSTSNLMVRLPSGLQQFILENNADTYLNGVVDTATGTTITYLNYNISKRPITYMSNYVDTYTISIAPSGLHGQGALNSVVDAYGTLITPAGTFSNVLRLKRTQEEKDSIGVTEIITTTVSYLWFDSMHAAPLLRIDSVIGIVGAGNTIMYLVPSLAVKKAVVSKSNYQCYWRDNTLQISGDLDRGKNYEVRVYDMVGTKVYGNQFIAWGSQVKLDIARYASQGIYMVSIIRADDPRDNGIVKVVKQ